MYDKGKVITGLVIFLAVFTFPLWSNLGKAAPVPNPELPAKEVAAKCVEGTDFMRTTHMQLLHEWRDSALRDGKRMYAATDGTQFTISLQNTCMECHKSKAKFCDSCHNYMGVQPYCWTCHIAPQEEK